MVTQLRFMIPNGLKHCPNRYNGMMRFSIPQTQFGYDSTGTAYR